MYPYALIAHSLLRWVVLALAVLAAVSALGPLAGIRRRLLPFVIALDLQVIVGLALWISLSPVTSFSGGALGDVEARHFTMVHPAMGAAAVVLAHTANVFLKRGFPQAKVLLWLALAAVLLAVPWGRPMLRL
ncbi:MAG: hypothetical protein HZB56_02455 [Deltaproteobacteria bacterium]|nr:hypothetical protein [Deltaproteobacteria bacterium]